MYEAAVVAFMCREAGGLAVDESGDPVLDIQPENHHQRTALYVGSRELVEDIAPDSEVRGPPLTPGMEAGKISDSRLPKRPFSEEF